MKKQKEELDLNATAMTLPREMLVVVVEILLGFLIFLVKSIFGLDFSKAWPVIFNIGYAIFIYIIIARFFPRLLPASVKNYLDNIIVKSSKIYLFMAIVIAILGSAFIIWKAFFSQI